MGQRGRTLAQILGFDGFRVTHYFETPGGVRIAESNRPSVLRGATLVLVATRRWLPCCGECGRPAAAIHQRLPARRWHDRSWSEHPVVIEYAPVRIYCKRCLSHPVELIAWADRGQRQTRRLQQHSSEQRDNLGRFLSANRTLMHAYTVKEQLRDVLRAETRAEMELGLEQVLRRTARRANVPMRKLHNTLARRFDAIAALGEHRPPTGRIEALNNNWETLVPRHAQRELFARAILVVRIPCDLSMPAVVPRVVEA